MTSIRIFCLAAACAGMAMGQSYNLKGRVLDKVGMKPVPGALVQISGGAYKATTDSAGRFNIVGATALGPHGPVALSAPYFRDGDLYVQAARAGQSARVEFFGLDGEIVSSASFTLEREGWNHVSVASKGDFHGFARITTAGQSYVQRLLSLSSPDATARMQWAGETAPSGASARAAAKIAAGSVDVTADKLMPKNVAFTANDQDLGDIVLDYPARKLDVGAPPIYGAYVLFDGSKGQAAATDELKTKWKDWIPEVTGAELAKYTAATNQFKIMKDPQYLNDTNHVTLMSCCNSLWGYDDIQAVRTHADVQVHVEFVGMGQYDNNDNANVSDPITETPRGAGYYNSGVYLQSRYEVQIYTVTQDHTKLPGNHEMAALVDDYAASANATRPNGQWQAYDITFRSARYDATGKKLQDAYVSMWWNGVQVHNNRDAHAPATGLDPNVHSGEPLNATLYGLKLQCEGTDVRFRNIWVKDLNITDTNTNFGY